jgi:hypothetical protein
LVNFTKGDNTSNAPIIKLCRGNCPDGQFTLQAQAANVPVTVTVLGYFYPKDSNIVTVAKDGGDFTDLFAAVAYLKGLATPPSATNPWVVQIDPGTYDLGPTHWCWMSPT